MGKGEAKIPEAKASAPLITASQWREFDERGFVSLGHAIPPELLASMEARIDDIMLGRVDYADKLIMQLDPGGEYGAAVAQQTTGFKGATVKYRKIGEAGAGLECDPVYREAMGLPIFREACARMYGAHCDIAVYRAMVFSKTAGQGTTPPWHQDGGDWWGIDRDPLVFVWTAIDEATRANGCVKVVPGSHKHGILSRRGHTLSPEVLEMLSIEANGVDVEVKPGESIMMHNWLVHSSGTNPTGVPRRAFSVNYMDARTRVLDPKPTVQPEGITRLQTLTVQPV